MSGRSAQLLGLLSVLLFGVTRTWGASSPWVVFSTGFEPPAYVLPPDYPNSAYFLADQDGWISDAVGGSQVFSNYFVGFGQHALIGFSPPEGNVTNVSVWRPLNFDPVAAGLPVVTFSVLMEIADSQGSSRRDSFRWSVYNTNQVAATRLFSLDFDNADRSVSYLLDDGQGFIFTPYQFERGGAYDLEITMDFASNRWSATLQGDTQQSPTLLVQNQPMTTRGSPLHLGDIDAVWVRNARNAQFGNNFMVFDDYRVVAQAGQAAPFRLELIGHLANGAVLLRLSGEPDRAYAIEASSNFATWQSLKTNIATGGSFEYLDAGAAGVALRFYRGRLVP